MNSRQVFTFSFLARVALPMCVFGFVATAHAQTPEAPVILEFGSAGCVPSAEICGDGVDQNCDGSDLLCPGSDPDADGYGTGADCDNSNKKVYPGVAVACTASCGSGTALCQANGSYSACSCSPLCEAKGSGRCYYVSKLTGNDSNSGTFSQPLRSALRFSGDGNNPSTRIQLQAGDVVYFMSGQYDEWVQYGDDRIGLILINARGTSAAPIVLKAYPGANPVFAPSVQAIGIRLFQTDHVTLEGLEVTRAYQGGIQVSEADNSELKNLRVYDIDGVDNDNIAGIMIHTSDGVVVHHSMIHDNYDRTNADTGGEKTGNSRNVVLFGGGNIRFHHNSIFQTPATTADKTGACVSYKHRMTIPNAVFEVDHNMFWNCFDAAVITSTYNGKFHHNLIVDSDRSIDVRSHGGPDVLSNNVIEYNTIVNTPGPYFTPTESIESGGGVGPLTIRKNIIVHHKAYSLEGGIIGIEPYGANSTYNTVVNGGLLTINQNCYFNNEGVLFNLFAVNETPDRNLGGQYTFSAWKNRGYDGNSFSGDPELSPSYYPAQAACQSFGHYAQ